MNLWDARLLGLFCLDRLPHCDLRPHCDCLTLVDLGP
jgi:hypothetical protein